MRGTKPLLLGRPFLRLHWRDSGNGAIEAETRYEIEVRRDRRWLPDPVVARATVTASTR